MSKIIAVHLQNDRNGNTLVFRQSLETLAENGQNIHLITNRTGDTPGFLSGLPGVTYHYINYSERGNKWRVFFSFLLAQLIVFRKVWGLLEPEAKVYINTLLPFGAAWASRLKKTPVTYHIHETAVAFPLLRQIMLFTAKRNALQVVFGSRYLQGKFDFPNSQKHIVHSCLPQSFVQEAVLHSNHGSRKTVLMIAPLDKESGLPELMQLANLMPATKFELVIDASQKDIDAYFHDYFIPDNLMVYGTQLNLHPFYQRAAVVLNLANTEQYQETFDFSILQAMSYGRPVIVPMGGGVNELVAHGWNGYRISGHYVEKVRKHVEQLLSNKPLYADMSCAAQLVASQFKPEFFKQQVGDLFSDGTFFTPRKKEQLAEVLLYPAALQEYLNNAMN
ncbi:glycosyltransferase family 4 protein [Chitinophaga rhizophila]|uniref:Glycosyltransferase family 4 protein n=1 Tax=Chitinophaga rhizophila TaxID=2866212 RepID=A0ABS7GK66_9BACT|nr:glycosyltransferase family 4 protein [Chitinophaga rhizophila]MBW8686833.1 glycosyltransferase family 4 protein [Chitinophaga rhizophila]